MASTSEERMSIGMILVQCEDTLKTHIDVTKVADTMLNFEKADEILGKTTRKRLEKSKKKADIKFILAVLKCLELPGFALLLESLEQIRDEKHRTALTLIATYIPNLSLPPPSPQDPLISEAVEKVKRVHSVCFKRTKHHDVPEQVLSTMESLTIGNAESPGHDPGQSIQTTILPSAEQTEIQSTTVSTQSLSQSLADDDSISVLIGKDDVPEQVLSIMESSTIGNAESPGHDPGQSIQTTILPSAEQTEIQSTTVSTQSLSQSLADDDSISVLIGKDGGMLYSSIHGITVRVPATAVPHKFELSMTASLSSTIPIGPDYIPCSAIVSLTTNPKIEIFLDNITVSVPHCGVSMQDYYESYCLLSHSDGQPSFEEDANIEVDFTSEWRCISFKTRHFTRFVTAGKQKDPTRKQPVRLAKLKSKSLEHHCKTPEVKAVIRGEFHRSASDPLSQSTYLPDVRYCLGMFTPLRKESFWKVVFLTCLDVHTGHAVSQPATERKVSKHTSIIYWFRCKGYSSHE